ncbi:MAG: N-acetyl sugar amidotransferase [Vicinamibacterales bacterium]|jgi:N-acetyl sugar amidotransferase|nr:N-acetyl sugar amidotransferase [Vicinamibacterales bacterium]
MPAQHRSRAALKIRSSLDRQLGNQPSDVVFCRRCVVSNQRPRITFDEEGVCSACRFAHEKHHVVDWEQRGLELRELCERHRRTDGRYDVIVPGSGGKDSAAVAHKLKHDYGMHPLTVTWAPFVYTDIGWQNYQRFVASGFPNLLAWPNGLLHRKLAKAALISVGDPFVPFIYGQMAYAFHVALQFDIPLLFFGENGDAEYGGSARYAHRAVMPLEDWAELYFKGVTADDLVEWALERGVLRTDDYTQADLTFYKPPPLDALQARGVQMHWFSYYQKWVPQENYYHAVEHTGFQANPEGRSEGTYSKYASLDDRLDGLHFYFSFVKFGIGRATSDAAHEVRDGHLTREEAVALVQRFDGEVPKKHFRESLEYLDMTEAELWQVVDWYRTRAPHLWQQVDGEWRLMCQVEPL